MTADPAIIEAAARALLEYDESDEELPAGTTLTWDDAGEIVREHYRKQARIALTPVTPRIEAAALEKAAQAIEASYSAEICNDIADTIRALKRG